MPSTTKLLASAALGLTLACLAPAAGYASEVAIPAAGCTQVPVAGVPTVDARSGGGFAVTGGNTASLVCAVSTDDLDSSSDDDDDDDSGRLIFRVFFADSDGVASPKASVRARLYRTTLAAAEPVVVDTPVCGTDAPLAGRPTTPGQAQATFACPRLVENAFYHLKVSLTSTAGSTATAAFTGVVAED